MATAPELPFQVVLDDHGPVLYRHLVGVLGPHDGADCYQEAVVAALRAWPPNHDGNLRAWLFTIAHRKVIDAARARARRPVPVAELPTVAAGAVAAPAASAGDADDLWAAVRRLPAKQRAAVALRHGEDWAYGEIASALGCSEAAARQSVKAGLDRLRQEGWT
ncbi:MAG: sigma-70 family RNA polymerase sigma factor [Acidimicrobiia bacterium]|nr:sigma-70 family RNA polymerase sigma factor [Acidimicrobiia bacterium]